MANKNRAKEIRRLVKQLDKHSKVVMDKESFLDNLRWHKCQVSYDTTKDEFWADVGIYYGSQLVTVYGIINTAELAGDTIHIHTPMEYRDTDWFKKRKPTAYTLNLVRKDAPEMYDAIRNYIDSVGDALDNEQELPQPLNLQLLGGPNG